MTEKWNPVDDDRRGGSNRADEPVADPRDTGDVTINIEGSGSVVDTILARSSIVAETSLDWVDVQAVAEDVLEREGYACEWCDASGGLHGEVDLLLTYQTPPYEFDDEEDALSPENLVVVCTACHDGGEVAASAPAGTPVREHVAHSLTRFERVVASNTPSLFAQRYWKHIVGLYVFFIVAGGAGGVVLRDWPPLAGAKLVATAPVWGLEWLVSSSPFVLFGAVAVVLAGYSLLEFYVPDEFIEGEYASGLYSLSLTGVILSAVAWIPSYTEAVLGIAVPSLGGEGLALVVFVQFLVAPVMGKLVWADRTRLLDRSLLARASASGEVSGESLVRVAREDDAPLAGQSFYPLVWLYLAYLSVAWFAFAVAYEGTLLSTLSPPLVLLALGMPTLVVLGYKLWRMYWFSRVRGEIR